MSNCDAIRERLAEEGVDAAENVVEIKRHLEGCDACTDFLNDLHRIESGLQDLPSYDASDAVVADTLRAVRQAAMEQDAPGNPGTTQRYVAAGLAASVVIAAGLGLTLSFREPSYETAVANLEVVDRSSDLDGAGDQLARGPVSNELPSSILRESQPVGSKTGAQSGGAYEESGSEAALKNDSGDDITESFETAQRGLQKKSEVGEHRSQREGERRTAGQDDFSFADQPLSDEEVDRELDVIAQLEAQLFDRQRGARDAQNRLEEGSELARIFEPEEQAEPVTTPSGAASNAKQQGLSGTGEIVGDLRANKPQAKGRTDNKASESESIMPLAEDKNIRTKSKDKDAVADIAAADPAVEGEVGKSGAYSQPVDGFTGGTLHSYGNKSRNLVALADPQRAQVLAASFLSDYQSLDRLLFQDSIGYWANSYIPGDPAMRLLQARLRAWDRTVLGQDLQLEQSVQKVHQPFDGPQDAALAVYLRADTPMIDGPTRLRVQVGLKGAERQGGHRPAMNVALVVDLRSIADADVGARIRALISALDRARQPGDRLSLTVAGPDGGLLVPPEEFRHGPLRIAIERMLGASREAASSSVDLRQALALATENVLAGDDPSAVLGSSLVLMVTGSSLAEDLAELERMAHKNAVGGVTLSVVSLVARDDLEHIDRLVAAGQGNRRILDTAQAADGLVDRELHAASRAVARALRLRIRLAPGVKLIDVLGSRRLAEPLAQRVREAEQSIDQRLARNLGIEADRGDDEEGIQIVIPNFYAGDTHTILLDVVAERPGPVAEVTARYKDVVYLRNGGARANLTIGSGQKTAGPLELNVSKNLVAMEFARQTRQISRYLAQGDPQRATLLLASLRDLIHGLRLEVTGWQSDPDLIADETMLGEYLAVLATPAAGDLVQRQYLADSLRLAAFRKLQTAAR